MPKSIKRKAVCWAKFPCMSLPYHRGQVSNNNNMSQRGNWGTRDQRADEASRTLMELENDRKWVTILFFFQPNPVTRGLVYAG